MSKKAQQISLPLDVVDRDQTLTSKKRGLWPFVKCIRFFPLLISFIALGGFIGLYFQPPGLQKLMEVLDLEPGGGTSSPIAMPVKKSVQDESALNPNGSTLPTPVLATPEYVLGLGKLQPLGDITVVAMPFGAADARIASIHVKEGDHVHRNDLLAALDNERSLNAAVSSAQAAVASKEAAFRQSRDRVIASRSEATAAVSKAEAMFVNARTEFDRIRTLRDKGIAANAAYDSKLAAYRQAARDIEYARATLSRYNYDNIETHDDVQLAMRIVDAAKADLARAIADLDKAYVRAPSAGTILTIHVHPGERPGPEGILNLGNIDQMVAEIEIYQNMIGQIEVGASATITAEALPRPLEGHVTRIGLEVGRQKLTDADPAANTDARVVRVYVLLSSDSTPYASRYVNLQVTARIASKVPE